MPSFVITEKCDGCKAGDKTACQYICPHDLYDPRQRENEKLTTRNPSSAGSALTA